jgi:5-methylcytosine-specific restriction endonuclease McrBC regulatory subunit McrC
MLMAGGEKVIIRLRDNSFGPASCENGRAGHSGQLIAELGDRAFIPGTGGGEVLGLRYGALKQILMRYQGRSLRDMLSGCGDGNDVVSFLGQGHGEMDEPVFAACADTWRNDDGMLTDCLRIDTGNVMGALRLRMPGVAGAVELQIGSRFDSGRRQFFLNYLLGKASGVDFSELAKMGDASFMQVLLAILFVRALGMADKVGLLREYRQYACNDLKLKGRVDIDRHIKTNYPLSKSIAYSKRELTSDLPLNRLIRRAIALVEKKWPWMVVRNAEARHFSEMVKRFVLDWDPSEKQTCLQAWEVTHPVSHPYYGACYEPLRILSRMLLMGDGFGVHGEDDDREVCGVLFDGAWLWESYIASVLEEEGFVHSDPATGTGVRYAFKSPCDEGELYPDFVSDSRKMILDAKYKRGWIHRDDRLQLMAYAFNTGYERLGLVFPPQEVLDEVTALGEEREIRQADMSRRYFWRNFVFKPIAGLEEEAFLSRMEESENALREFVRNWESA